MVERRITNVLQARRLADWLRDLAPEKLPCTIRITRAKPRKPEQNDALYAHFRDIACARLKADVVPERCIERVKEDFKRTDIWPRYADADPDYFTGEVLYRPKSCADLTALETGGILQWLDHYMAENSIPSRAPVDRWAA